MQVLKKVVLAWFLEMDTRYIPIFLNLTSHEVGCTCPIHKCIRRRRQSTTHVHELACKTNSLELYSFEAL